MTAIAMKRLHELIKAMERAAFCAQQAGEHYLADDLARRAGVIQSRINVALERQQAERVAR